jgi:hypothetical protein
MTRSNAPLRALWLLPLVLVGCAKGPSTVTGTVTLDGQPVANGSIRFIKEEGGALVREGAVITGGSFQAQVPPGKYRLELSGTKVTGKRTQTGFDGKDETIETTDELFPEKFNTKSVLSEEIKAGPNELKLDLQSK